MRHLIGIATPQVARFRWDLRNPLRGISLANSGVWTFADAIWNGNAGIRDAADDGQTRIDATFFLIDAAFFLIDDGQSAIDAAFFLIDATSNVIDEGLTAIDVTQSAIDEEKSVIVAV